MKKFKRYLFVVMVLLLGLAVPQTDAKPDSREDRTAAPYFYVAGGHPDTDRLPLKSTSAAVDISGVIANVLVTQIYKNEGHEPLEAVYIFPGSTRAAVYGMRMTIGERVIEARIKKRDDARREYEKARAEGRNASLLEQHRPNVFQMNVANIMPGDEIKVELKYTELLVPTRHVYEFVYPAVVGPRYAGARSSDSHRWVENPYLHQGELSKTAFDIKVAIHAGMPVRSLASPSHQVNPTYKNASEVKISLDKAEVNAGNRDFILRYRLDGEKIQTGLLLSQGEKENFFALMMQPPRAITPADIPGREYIFIVDVSGSMYGFPLSISKKLLADLIGHLRPKDKFNVLLFSGGNTLMAEESLPATSANIQKAQDIIDRQHGGGGTELLPALKRALGLKKEANLARSIVIVTDGYVSVEEEAFDLIRNHLSDANMFAFGIGSSVNRHLIEGMAHVGMGEPFVVTKPDEAEAQAERFRKIIQSPLLSQVKVRFSGFEAYEVEPVSVPDVLDERPVLVFGKWRGKIQGSITLTGLTGKGEYSETIQVEHFKASVNNAALQYLWARHRIMILSHYNKLRQDDRRVKEVTDLGLEYHLLTAYTSFVAADSEVRNADGKFTTVKQPLPLPEGVSDYAVGGYANAAAPALSGGFAIRHEAAPQAGLDKDKAYKTQTAEKKDGESRIGLTCISAGEGISRENVLKGLETRFAEIEKCLAGLAASGRIKIQLTLDASGIVKDIEIASGMMLDEKVKQCLAQEIRKCRFQAVTTGKSVRAVVIIKIK